MIDTGTWPLSEAAKAAVYLASHYAAVREPPIATCHDMFVALLSVPHGNASRAWNALGWPTPSWADEPAPSPARHAPPLRGDLIAHVTASRPLQRAIALSPDGAAITTGGLLLGLLRVEHSELARHLRQEGLIHTDLERALHSSAPE